MLIDLDADGGPERPGRMRRGRPDPRPLLLGLLLAGVLALVAGDRSTAPLTPSVVLHTDGVSDIRGDGQAIYVMTRSSLASYRMPDGARRWAVPVSAGAQLVAVDSGRVVLAVGNEDNTSAATLAGLDTATGAQVWRQTGYLPSLYGAAGAPGVVVANAYPPGADAASQQPANPDLAGIDIRTGVVRWSLVTPPGATRKLEPVESGDASIDVEIAELDPDGVLRLRSAETAEIMRTVNLENPGQVDGFDISGDRMLAYRTGESTMLSSAVFDLATGRWLWQRSDDPPGGPFL
jgi:outer membrane protein assembly factor BamB